jgi:predicted permease
MHDWQNEVRARLASLRLKPEREADIVDEIAQHLEGRYRDATSAGATPEEATSIALAEFRAGNALAQRIAALRQARAPQPIPVGASTGHLLEDLWQDLRYAARAFAKHKTFAATTVLILALGIGATTAIFSLFHQVLVQSLPVPEPERLVELATTPPILGGGTASLSGNHEHTFSYPMFRDLEQQQSVFTGLSAHRDFQASVAEELQTVAGGGMMVSGGYFSVLGLSPALGRLIGPQDEPQVGESGVVVLSHDYWQSRFAGDPDVIGRTLTVNGRELAVIGVAPEGFRGTVVGVQPRVFVPITLRWLMEPWRPSDQDDRRSRWVYLLARLGPGVSLEQASASINGVYGGIINEIEVPSWSAVPTEILEQFKAKRITLEPGGERKGLLRDDNAEPLTVLLGITALVLMIVSVNVANLLLVRGVSRAGEMAVRVTMGASRWRLVKQSLLEVGAIAVIGGVASLPVAALTLRAIGALLPEQLASALSMELSSAALAFAGAISLCTVLLFGAAPAVQAASAEPGLVLKGVASRTLGGRGMTRVRNALATAQIAFSTTLLALAGLLAVSFANIARIDLGIDVESVAMFSISPRTAGQSPERAMATFDGIEERLAAEPGVSNVGSSRIALLASRNWTNHTSQFQGFPNPPDVGGPINMNAVSSGFFRTLSIPVLAGRGFDASDTPDSPPVAVINESFARVFGLGDTALGTRFDLGRFRGIEIVGVIADTKYAGVTDDVPPTVFFPRQRDANLDGLTFYVRGLDPGALMRMIPHVVAEIDPSVPVTDLRTMEMQVRNDVYRERLIAMLSASFAVLATLLAAIGLYGVLAYNVAQRTRELGLRLALGAEPSGLRALVVKQVGLMTVIGSSIGLAAAAGLGRVAEALLVGLSGHDPAVLIAAVAAISLVVLGASYVPARRASRIAPMEALRYE